MTPSTTPSDAPSSREPGIVDLDADLGLTLPERVAIGLLVATALATAVAAMLLLAVSLSAQAGDPDRNWSRMPVPIVQTLPSAWRAPMTPTGGEALPPAPQVALESPDA